MGTCVENFRNLTVFFFFCFFKEYSTVNEVGFAIFYNITLTLNDEITVGYTLSPCLSSKTRIIVGYNVGSYN